MKIFLLFILSSLSGIAQSWEKIYGGSNFDVGRSVRECTDGGFIFCGQGWSTGQGIFIGKTDLYGDTVWTKSFGDVAYYQFDKAKSVIQTSDGGYVLTGEAFSFGGAFNSGDAFLIKLDSIGNLVWTKDYANYDAIDEAEAVIQTFDGGYIIASRGSYSSVQSNDWFLIKTDVNGDTVWTKQYYGYGIINGESVVQTVDSGFVLCGYIDAPVDTNGAYGITEGLFLMKTDVSGNTLWTKIYPYFNTGWTQAVNSIYKTGDGGFVIVGDKADATVISKSYLLKLDANGDSLWSQHYNLQGGINYAASVTETHDGGIAITGSSYDSVSDLRLYLLKTDSLGIQQWINYYQVSSSGDELHETSDKGFIIAGGYHQTSWDFYLIKTDSMGTVTALQDIHRPLMPLTVYPDPFDDEINIYTSLASHSLAQSSPNPALLSVTLFDITGRKILSQPCSIASRLNSGCKLVTAGFSPGIYFVEVIVDGEKVVRKVVKE